VTAGVEKIIAGGVGGKPTGGTGYVNHCPADRGEKEGVQAIKNVPN